MKKQKIKDLYPYEMAYRSFIFAYRDLLTHQLGYDAYIFDDNTVDLSAYTLDELKSYRSFIIKCLDCDAFVSQYIIDTIEGGYIYSKRNLYNSFYWAEYLKNYQHEVRIEGTAIKYIATFDNQIEFGFTCDMVNEKLIIVPFITDSNASGIVKAFYDSLRDTLRKRKNFHILYEEYFKKSLRFHPETVNIIPTELIPKIDGKRMELKVNTYSIWSERVAIPNVCVTYHK